MLIAEVFAQDLGSLYRAEVDVECLCLHQVLGHINGYIKALGVKKQPITPLRLHIQPFGRKSAIYIGRWQPGKGIVLDMYLNPHIYGDLRGSVLRHQDRASFSN